jgi:DNA polymerase (family X)
MDRRQVARVLEEMAAMLEIKGENPFKVRAYENGAHAILGMQEDLAEAVETGTLRQVPGIGAGLSANIEALVRTGSLPYYEELKAAFPPGLRECIRVPGFSARKAKLVFDALGVDSLDSLEEACRSGRIASLKGFGAKTAEKILKGISTVRAGAGLHKFSRARARAEESLTVLRAMRLAARVEIAGEIRRRCEIVGRAVFVAAAEDPGPIARAFRELPGIAEPFAEPEPQPDGEAGPVRVRFGGGLIGELVVAPPAQFGAAWLHATGSPAHLEALSSRALKRSLRLERGGLYKARGKKPLAAASEEEIYAALGLSFVEPELRENAGEIEAAADGRLPALIRREDLRGLIHVHTTESDGRDSMDDMLAAVSAAGYRWVAITDHSQTAGYAGGLTPDRVLLQRAAIREARKHFEDLVIFHGTEADILADGSIDYGDEFLDGFDVVVASVHSRFGLSREEQTRRLVRAVTNPRVTVLGHPTGRLLLSRDPIDVDLESVLDAAAASGCAVEINCSPDRLDLDWRFCRGAVERGIPMAIDPDAHSIGEIGLVPYGIGIARKGWVTAAATLNAKSAGDFVAWLEKRRGRPLPR